MKHKHSGRRLLSAAAAAALALAVMPQSVSADWQHIGCLGDLDRDQKVTLVDLIRLVRHIHAQDPLTTDQFYEVNGAMIGIGGADGFQAGNFLNTADLNQDGTVDVFDLALMKRAVFQGEGPWVWQWMDTPENPTQPDDLGDFITPPIDAVRGYLPPQGDSRLVILYVDFPDCPYDYAPDAEEIDQIAFGPENTADANYPFESASAFYERSSKGVMHLGGKAFRYTAQKNNAEYNDVAGRQALVKEALRAFEESEDFAKFDSDNDGFIDTTLLSVPKAAGDDNWWPCAGPMDDDNWYVDGKRIGHIITSNSQIASRTDYYNFNSTILHEMGHCMGLPDYYLYHGSDTEGMHGTAGSEMMDVDATSDFSCVSKLQYGWYRAGQIEVFDADRTTETYTLHNAQTDAGNVLVIPCGDLDAQYHSEYMLVEYTTQDRNNSHPGWWVMMDSGIRVYHVDATVENDYWGPSFLYGSGKPATNNDEGRRLLRIIDDRETDNLYRTGDVIDGTVSGFHWYDANGYQTVDTGISITVGALTEDGYEITVTRQ